MNWKQRYANEEDPVYGHNGTAWLDYNKRYTMRAKDGISGSFRVDERMVTDAINGDKRVAEINESDYNKDHTNRLLNTARTADMSIVSIPSGKSQAGIDWTRHLIAKNPEDINKYRNYDSKHTIKDREHQKGLHALIGYKPERFQ